MLPIILLALAAATASAQPRSTCDSTALTHPVGTMLDTLRLVVRPGAGVKRLPSPWTEVVTDEIGSRLRIEPPLVIPVFGSVSRASPSGPALTHPAMLNEVRLRLRPKGHVEAELTARSLADALDGALLRAIREADSAGVFAVLPDGLSQGSTLFLSLTTGEPADSLRPPDEPTIESIRRDLSILSLPLYRDATEMKPMPGNQGPRYPDRERLANVQGEVLVDFVVDESGAFVPSTLRLVRYTSEGFARAVFDALKPMRFAPATVGGCPVKTLVRQPFQFQLRR
jgi:TonB family protein